MSGPLVRRSAAAVGIAAITASTAFIGAPAAADPPQSADRVLAKYRKLSVEAERTSEAMNAAQEEYDKQRNVVRVERKKAKAASVKLAAMQADMDRAQKKIDALARLSYRGARVNRLYALLVSDSPQSLLDNMSGLEVMSRQAAADYRTVTKTARETKQAKTDAEASEAAATKAIAASEKKRGELQAKQSNLQLQAVQIRAIYQSMTGRQLAALRGPKYNFDPRSVPKGTAPGLVAVQAAVSRIGDPYVWGATGPDEFDCSGLMLWAFKQAGRTLPRTSQAQLAGGKPVDRNDLQPGDLVIFYPEATHVGMYVGDGFVVHASTFGVPVAVVPLDKAGPYNAARRY